MNFAIDLFCGAGGMSEGLIQAGFHILFSSDINEQVELTYKNRHEQLGLIQGYNTHYERADVRDLTGEFIMGSIKKLEFFKEYNRDISIDAIFGGPPCQGFSLAGRREKNDPRNILFKEYLRIIKEVKPKYVVMENVEGFMNTKLEDFLGLDNQIYDGNHLITDILISEFQIIGYKVLEPKILDASDYGVPQRRNRAIFIAHLPNVPLPKYPEPILNEDEKPKVIDAIGDLIYDSRKRKRYNSNTTKYQRDSINGRTLTINNQKVSSPEKFYNYEFSIHDIHIVERFSLFKEGESTSDLRKRIKDKGINLKSKPALLNLLISRLNNIYTVQELIDIFKEGNANDEMINILLTKKNNRIKLNSNKLSPTVVTMPDDYISPFENRIFSVREMARLQSFDDSFIFKGKRTTGGERRRFEVPQYSQVGNAIPPLLSKAIADEIIKVLKIEPL